MEKLSTARRAAVLQCLCEGNSIMSTHRITGTAKTAILDILASIGPACEAYLDESIVGLTSSRIELDEVWSFVGHKNRGKEDPSELIHDPQEGNVWTWKALCADSKLLIAFHMGGRTFNNAVAFCRKVAHRFVTPPQISTDGFKAYPMAVSFAFGDVDYSRLIKIYGKDKNGNEICTGARKERVFGNPDMEKTCTSYVERSNLTLRMQNKRFARKTIAHSKKLANHRWMFAIHAMNYNFCRVHQGLKRTPAMAAGIASRKWSFADVVTMADQRAVDTFEAACEAAFAAGAWSKPASSSLAA